MADTYSTRGHPIGPAIGSRMSELFADWYTKQNNATSNRDYLVHQFDISNKRYQHGWDAWRKHPAVSPSEATASDPFYYNNYDLAQFYSNLNSSGIYKGMLEGIGKIFIYASQYVDTPFAKFIKDPLTYGNAVMTGMFRDIRSHDWNRTGPETHNVKGFIAADLGGSPKVLLDATDTPRKKDPLFAGETPPFIASVSRINFSREISLKVDALEFARYCQSPDMVGQISASLMSQSTAIYRNDLAEAAKNFFCGIIRSGPPPEHELQNKGKIVYGQAESYGDRPHFGDGGKLYSTSQKYDEDANKMLARVVISKEARKDHETLGHAIADGVSRIIFNTIHNDFADFSTEYNPAHESKITSPSGCSVILDTRYYYDLFLKYYADLNNPSYIEEAVKNNIITLPNGFPVLGTTTYATQSILYDDVDNKYDDGGKHYYQLIGMIVDNENLAIYPYRTPVSVQTFFNPQQENTTIFTHYEMDYEFKPYFNRKYIFLDFVV